MKPPRNIPALLLALSLCLALAACSPGGSQTSTQPSAPASQAPSSAPAQASDPAGARQIDELEQSGLAVDGTRVDLLQNKVALITYKGSGTSVTTLSEIGSASSVALAGSSVPVGQYTRTALQALGILDSGRDAAEFTAQEVSEALGGVEINETANVSATLNAVAEGSNEVGTVYYSDAYSRIDDVEILELVDSSLTGDIIYPMSRVVNPEAGQAQTAAADDFYAFLQTDAVMDIFERYLFVSNLEG